MTFDDLIKTAKEIGYRNVYVGDDLMTLDEYAIKYRDNRTYNLYDDGTITTVDDEFEWFGATKLNRFILVNKP